MSEPTGVDRAIVFAQYAETMPDEPRDLVFLSYSHKDKRWLDELLAHLKPYIRDGSISAWSDRHIKPGSKWMDEIRSALQRTRVAVLMVTHHFLASDFIHEHELTPLLTEAEAGGLEILWIPIRACSFEESPIQRYQSAIDPAKPINRMRAERDAAWVQVCRSIKSTLQSAQDGRHGDSDGTTGNAAILPMRVVHSEVKPLPHRKALRDLERSMAGGALQDSSLAPVIHDALSREQALELCTPLDSSWLIDAIRLSDAYFGPIGASAGQRDWQRDFVAVAAPVLVGISRSFQRSISVQSLVIRLCNQLANHLHLRLVWPVDPDEYNDLANEIYAACLDACDLESGDVYTRLKRLTVVGPVE